MKTLNKIFIFLILLTLSAGLLFLVEYHPGRPVIKSVLLISVDTCRADFLSYYGYPYDTTPNIDAIARENILFENVVSPVPLTLPAHISMLTGTIPPYHGIHDNLSYRLADSHITLAEVMKENGFTTGALVSAFVLDSQFGLNQGFDTYNDKFDEAPLDIDISELNQRKGSESTRYALEWINEHKNERFFYFLHYYDPHVPYEPPAPFDTKFPQSAYAGEIAFVDFCIGMVVQRLKELDLFDSTLIIITGDHGEMLGEHGEVCHGFFVYQSALKVPLIFKLSGNNNRPIKIKEQVGLIDILPTVCGLLGIQPPQAVQGHDLSPYILGKTTEKKERDFYCESLEPTKYRGNSLLGVITGGWKYIQTTRPELYDLQNDPEEMNNLIEQQPQRGRIMQDKLKQILDELRENNPDSRIAIDEQSRKRLESLGYVSGQVSEDFTFDQSKNDPKDLIQLRVTEGMIIYCTANGLLEEAKQLCEKLIKEYPEFGGTYIHLSKIAFEEHDEESTFKYYKLAIEQNPDRADVQSNYGMALAERGNITEGIAHLEKSLELSPDQIKTHADLAGLLEKEGRYEEAREHYLRSLQIKNNQPEIHVSLGNVYYKLGKSDDAIKYWENAITLGIANSHIVFNNIGGACYQKGNLEKAAESWQKSLELKPDQSDVESNLGDALYGQNKLDEAITHYNKSLKLDSQQADAHSGLAEALVQKGELDEAIRHYEQSLSIQSEQPMLYERIAGVLQQQGKTNQAIEQYKKLLQLAPSEQSSIFKRMAKLYFLQGDYLQSVEYVDKVLEIEPENVSILNNAAWLRCAYADSRIHDPAKAVQLAYKACNLTNFGDPTFMHTLSVAYVSAGRFAEAVGTADKALELAKKTGKQELVKEIKESIELFKQEKPLQQEH